MRASRFGEGRYRVLFLLELGAQLLDLPLELATAPRDRARLARDLLLLSQGRGLVTRFLGQAGGTGKHALLAKVDRLQFDPTVAAAFLEALANDEIVYGPAAVAA